MFEQCNLNMKKWLGTTIALGAMVTACSNMETVGTSEESEGIVAIANKNISGAVQKGPFVTGSSVILRETSAEGNLEPTGKEYATEVINDKGDFKFDSLDLESQYALLSAEGHYTHDVNGERSACVLHLNAVTNMEKRNTANINLLTHFEYKRVLKLVKDGVPFAQAKKRASAEVLGAFGVHIPVNSAEDLNIFSSSAADMTLYHISIFVDTRDFLIPWHGEGDEWEYMQDPANTDCARLQAYVDGYADDLEEDGLLSDSLIAPLAYSAYLNNTFFGNVIISDETGLDDGRDPYDLMAERRYFYRLVLDHYLGFETCDEDHWGESRRLDKPFVDDNDDWMTYVNPAYFLCDGRHWKFTTKEHLDSLKTPIPHKMGTMTDPRDNKKYKTVSFEFNGKKYEWMAEDLKYIVPSDAAGKKEYVVDGLYSWTSAMQVDYKYMFKPVKEGLIDSLHQGICPDGWHVSSAMDWVNLVAYVGGMNNLLDESWRTDEKTARAKGLYGVFTNRFDFNLEPMDKKYLDLYYHTYSHKSFVERAEAELDSLFELAEDSDELWIWHLIDGYRYELYSDNVTMEISIDYGRMTSDMRKKARVRCVKN